MKRIITGILLGLMFTAVTGNAVLADAPEGVGGGCPRSIHIVPGERPQFNVLPGDNLQPPHIRIDTPNGTKEPTL